MAKIFAVDPKASYVYVLKSQRDDPEEEQIKWHLKHLNAREETLLEDKLGHVRDGDFHIKLGTQNRLALDIGLESVEGFTDKEGNAIEVERTGKKTHGFVKELKSTFVDRIPKAVRQEIAQAILEGHKMEVEEAKN